MTIRVAIAALLSVAGVLPLVAQGGSQSRVLIVTDRRELAGALAAGLDSAERIQAEIVSQGDLPTSLTPYRAVLMAMNGALDVRTSRALQAHVGAGGRLIAMHRAVAPHQPAEWMAFLGVRAVSADVTRGGFRALSNVPVELVALTHRSPVIETKIAFDRAVPFSSASRPREMRLPGLAIPPTVVFINHVSTRLKRPLLGLKVTDPRSGMTYMQDTAAWVDELQKGLIYYFMVGERASDFGVKPYVQMIANAVIQ